MMLHTVIPCKPSSFDPFVYQKTAERMKKEFTDETGKAQMIPKCHSRESFHLICMKAVH